MKYTKFSDGITEKRTSDKEHTVVFNKCSAEETKGSDLKC